MAADPLAQTPEGARLLERTLDMWLARAGLMALMRAQPRPSVIWAQGVAPYTWQGGAVPSSGTMMDNLDYCYRGVKLDGTRDYVMTVRSGPKPSGGLSFQITADHDGRVGFMVPKPGDAFATLPVHDVRDFTPEDDGSFRIGIGSGAANERNHIPVPPKPLQITVRDAFNDWNENPYYVSITAADGRDDRGAVSEAHVARVFAEEFPHYAAFWQQFKDRYSANSPPNTPVGPQGGGGGPGYNLKVRFKLADDEALVGVTKDIPTTYFSAHTADLWLMTADPLQHMPSRNRAQSLLGPDGTYTFVYSRHDPGVANWIDTGGCREGFIAYRWVGTQPDEDLKTLIGPFQVVKIDDLPRKAPHLPRVSRAQRAQERAQRLAQWKRRVAA
jgi:hypothetical protein